MSDMVSSPDVAYAIAQAAFLPTNIEKEKDQTYNALMKSAMQASVRVFLAPFFLLFFCSIYLCYYIYLL